MTILEGLLTQIKQHLKGVQVFHVEDIPNIIRKHNLIFADDVLIDNDNLVLKYQDTDVWFKLTWRQEGPRQTLINIELQ